MIILGWIVLLLALMLLLSYQRASLIVFTIGIAVYLLLLSGFSSANAILLIFYWLLFLIIFLPLNILPLRRHYISRPLLAMYRRLKPSMSSTEKEALTAGGVGWTADIFSGMPNWNKLHTMPLAKLSAEEQTFLDDVVERLCSMIDNWKISRTMQISDEILEFLKREGFFGMIIPKQYGGKEFSASAHSQVIIKVSSISVAVSTLISVPNSLGPAELLLHYGTEEQKNYYLPRLARGEEIPCFALTSPVAGSDASSITDYGVVCRHEFAGKEQLCMRLTWNKRYITLAPIATILGLAFKLYDPEHLLGNKDELGITCALVPVATPGVEIGQRHYPLDCAFPNGPTCGKEVIVPLDWIIGGAEMVGSGWRMLMECLAAGRSISLPSMVTGGARKAALASGAYARVRRQFNTHIGNFDGVVEALARMAGHTYAIEACRRFTISALDQGQRPVVASAISKYHTTELSRTVLLDAMDVHGGKGICMGPNNYLAQGYIESPIGITVEGANILTRNMIIFGQGAIRCHPFLLPEILAAEDADEERGLRIFDRALFQHIGFIISNFTRSLLLGLSNGYIAQTPKNSMRRYYQLFTRFSAVLAFAADICLLTIGAGLKRRERLSARLGDLLSLLYMGSAIIKIYEENGDASQRPVARWACLELLYRLQGHLVALIQNIPQRPVAWLLRIITMPLGQRCKMPNDRLGTQVAKLLLQPTGLRNYFAAGLYMTPQVNNPFGYLHEVLTEIIMAEPIEKKVYSAKKQGLITGKNLQELILAAVRIGIIEQQEGEQLTQADEKRMKIINVDAFTDNNFLAAE